MVEKEEEESRGHATLPEGRLQTGLLPSSETRHTDPPRPVLQTRSHLSLDRP